MQNNDDLRGFLTERGERIYQMIKSHVSSIGIEDVDILEMAMLANSYDLYISNMEICKNENTFKNKHDQVRAEFTVMQKAYDHVLKHGAKFGLNPGDRAKIFDIKKKDSEKKKGFDLK
jgi:phage terminase small subunit